jgi:hypothetical protein
MAQFDYSACYHRLICWPARTPTLGPEYAIAADGYVGAWSRRSRRWGHVLQNRYKSVVLTKRSTFSNWCAPCI